MNVSGNACLWVVGTALALLLFQLLRNALRTYLHLHNQMADRDLAALFVVTSGARIAWLTAGFLLLVTGMAWLCGLGWPFLVTIAVCCLFVPRWSIDRIRSRRLRRIGDQLPDALAFWAGLLRSGQGLHPALSQLAEHQSGPLGDELRVVVRQCRLGVPVETAIHDLCDRIEIADLRLLSSLLRVARDLGGNLGDSLLRLSDLLRSRLAMEARVASLTAQGRLQGAIVGALPLLLLLVLSVMEPAAMSVLFREPMGWVALGVIALLEVLGYLLIRRIVAIEI